MAGADDIDVTTHAGNDHPNADSESDPDNEKLADGENSNFEFFFQLCATFFFQIASRSSNYILEVEIQSFCCVFPCSMKCTFND